MSIDDKIAVLDEKKTKQILTDLLTGLISPAFGVLPKSEIDIIILEALANIGFINNEPDVYELINKLKITKTKARNLIYQRDLRRVDEKELKEQMKIVLKKPVIEKQGEQFALDVENPLLSDYIRQRVRELGYITDGSFSSSIVKLKVDAFIALLGEYLDSKDQGKVKKLLVEIGMPDGSFKSVLKGALKKMGAKVASDAGEELAGQASDWIVLLFEKSFSDLAKKSKSLLT